MPKSPVDPPENPPFGEYRPNGPGNTGAIRAPPTGAALENVKKNFYTRRKKAGLFRGLKGSVTQKRVQEEPPVMKTVLQEKTTPGQAAVGGGSKNISGLR